MNNNASTAAFARDIAEVARGAVSGPLLARLVAQLLYWASCQSECTVDIPRIEDTSVELTVSEWKTIRELLANDNPKGPVDALTIDPLSPRFQPGQLERIRRTVARRTEEYLADHRLLVDLLSELASNSDLDSWGCVVPKEVSELLRAFVPVDLQSPVYCAFAPSFRVALDLLANGKSAAFEASEQEFTDIGILAAYLMAAHDRFTFRQSDPVLTPGFVDENGDPQKFAIALACLPIGLRYGPEIAQSYPHKAAFGEVYQLSRLLMHSKHIVVHMGAGFLIRTSGGERSYKEMLVREGAIRSVIAIPGGVLMPLTAVKTAVMDIDFDEPPTREILFVSSDRLTFAEDRPASAFPADRIIKTLRERAPTPWAAHVSTDTVIQNDLSLAAERYVVGKVQQGLMDALKSRQSVTLDEVVELIRPQPAKSASLGEVFWEIATSDVDQFGFVTRPTKKVLVPPGELSKIRRHAVKRGDVLISIKGRIGLVALVDHAPQNWIAGQSFVIARLREHGPIQSPQVLARYLRSFGQGLMDVIAHGATVRLIQMNDLKRLVILVPSLAEQQEVSDYFHRLQELQSKLAEVRHEFRKLNRETWPMATVEEAADANGGDDDHAFTGSI